MAAGRKRSAPKPSAKVSSAPLERYRAKRDFTRTNEPPPVALESGDTLTFTIQKHAASRLNYDLAWS